MTSVIFRVYYPSNLLVISTANVRPIVNGARDVLINKKIIPEGIAILASELSLVGLGHVNAGAGKGVGLKKWMLDQSLMSSCHIDVYCDDPEGTDSGLAQIANRVFLAPDCFIER